MCLLDLNEKEVYNLTENVIQNLIMAIFSIIMAIFSNPCSIILPCQLLLNRSVIFHSPSDKVYSGRSNIVNNFKSVSFHIFNEIQRSQPLSLCIQVLMNVDLMMGANFGNSGRSAVQQCSV